MSKTTIKPTDSANTQVLHTFFLLCLLGVAITIASVFLKNSALEIPVYLAIGALAVGIHISRYRKGGVIPQNGRRTIHSIIIFMSTIAAVVLLLSAMAYLYVVYL